MMISGQTAAAITTSASVAGKTAKDAGVAAAPPSASTASAAKPVGKKDFATVATEARAAIDAGYKTLGKTGDIHTTGKEWGAVLAGMDRRSLYAIASNAGGQFSEAEQGGASSVMEEQMQAAQGIDAGNPASIMAYQANIAASTKAGIAFLDSVSDEEKQSVSWAANRASMQNFHSIVASESGQQAENLDSDNPLVKVLATAMKASRGDPARDRSEGRFDTLEGLKNQPWAKGFEAQIDQASRAVARQGSLVDQTV